MSVIGEIISRKIGWRLKLIDEMSQLMKFIFEIDSSEIVRQVESIKVDWSRVKLVSEILLVKSWWVKSVNGWNRSGKSLQVKSIDNDDRLVRLVNEWYLSVKSLRVKFALGKLVNEWNIIILWPITHENSVMLTY